MTCSSSARRIPTVLANGLDDLAPLLLVEDSGERAVLAQIPCLPGVTRDRRGDLRDGPGEELFPAPRIARVDPTRIAKRPDAPARLEHELLVHAFRDDSVIRKAAALRGSVAARPPRGRVSAPAITVLEA